jgi:hypothetical protein
MMIRSVRVVLVLVRVVDSSVAAGLAAAVRELRGNRVIRWSVSGHFGVTADKGA